MIKGLWNRYISWLLNYLDTDNGLDMFKMLWMQIIHVGFIFIIIFTIFYLILGSKWLLMMFAISGGYGKLFLDQVLSKYDKNHPYDKRYIPFLRFIATSTIIFVTLGGTFMLIKDAQENQSVMSKFLSDEQINKNIELNSSNQIVNDNVGLSPSDHAN